jgi:hypothetical protein
MADKTGTLMHFDGNRFWFEGDRGFEIFEIDATTEPFRIDYWEAGTAVEGIYKIVDSTLFECSAPPGVARPITFDPRADRRYICIEAQRTPGAK